MNIIDAIMNLVQHPVTKISSAYVGRNRVNSVGDALEEYVKDLFSNSFEMSTAERRRHWQKVFSYFGNTSNPPDAMLRGGDAIEVKKIETDNAAIALNSSYPKHTLRATSPMITEACRNAEKWTEKDIIYVVGVVEQGELKHLCMVYGLDYCASEECYTRIKDKIKDGISQIPGIESAETRELGRINKVDPLGITYMRVRGMWGIENPTKVFEYVYKRDNLNKFTFMCLINCNKWKSFQNRYELEQLADKIDELRIEDVSILNPDNPSQLNAAKLITFYL